MIPLIRSFKRHYHLVKGMLPKMYRTGSFGFQLKFDQTTGQPSGQVKSKTPAESETIRFVVLMRRFLNPLDPIYYANMWNFLRESFATEIPLETVKQIEKSIEEMNKGYGQINYNDEILTAEKIYRLVLCNLSS